ncbi:MAG: RNA polymerase sporulation sigma factor SigG [Tenericutes bacterium]|nr:RNA polymerase sporulation sigma factor SigG [Mycoplasmatota bacterium]
MARHKVEICGVNTADIKVLKSEEMVVLFKKYQKGDLSAKEELINGNLKLILSILKKYINRTDNMDDLFQVGCIGLIKAIDNFDLSHEVKFSTYAVPMILGEIRRYLRDNNSLRVSRYLKDLAYHALKLKEELTNENGKQPSLEEIAEKLEVPIYDLISALEAIRDPISMFEPIYNEGGDTIYLFDQIEDTKCNDIDLDNKLALAASIKKLSKREQMILEQRFIIGKTQVEIANELGISQAQISRLEKSAINNIRKNIN